MTRAALMISSLLLLAPGVGEAFPRGPQVAPGQRRAQQPQGSARIEVLVVEASMGIGGVASVLSPLPQLRQPPFSAFTQMNLVSRNTFPLGSTAVTAALGPAGRAEIALGGRSPEGRYTVNVSFSRGGPSSTIQFVVAPGEPFFTVRSSRPDRALVIGFIVR